MEYKYQLNPNIETIFRKIHRGKLVKIALLTRRQHNENSCISKKTVRARAILVPSRRAPNNCMESPLKDVINFFVVLCKTTT